VATQNDGRVRILLSSDRDICTSPRGIWIDDTIISTSIILRKDAKEVQISKALVGFQGRGFADGVQHGCAVTPDDRGYWVVLPFETPFDGAYPADPLLEFFLRMPVRLVDGFRGFMEVMKVTELMRHLGEGVGHGTAHIVSP
jgi:hypothetical protein